MGTWDKVTLEIEAIAPVIVSASRSTDIPAFYADWFIDRLKKGYLVWINPFNRIPSVVSFEKTKAIVFWTKNPAPIIKHLDYLDGAGISYYFQYTVNDYETEQYEPNVPPLKERIQSFKELSTRLENKDSHKKRVIWRFDPLILNDSLSVDDLIEKIEKIGNELKGYTDKLIFSFVDIDAYKKVQNNRIGTEREFRDDEIHEFAQKLSDLNRTKGWHLELATCGETVDLTQYGIVANACIDGDFMQCAFQENSDLMSFLDKNNVKDSGQRQACGCMVSKDIGQYSTCQHFCTYCYANKSKSIAETNWKRHLENPGSATITGENSLIEKVIDQTKERKEKEKQNKTGREQPNKKNKKDGSSKSQMKLINHFE